MKKITRPVFASFFEKEGGYGHSELGRSGDTELGRSGDSELGGSGDTELACRGCRCLASNTL